MNLDFSTLTDDQLVELIRLSVAEAVQRGEATAAAAYNIGADGVEQMRIRQAAAAAEAARQAARAQAEAEAQAKAEAAKEAERVRWTKRGKLALAFREALVDLDGWQINVWARGTEDKRVYLQKGRRGPEAVLYVSGNYKQPPGTLETSNMQSHIPGLRREDEAAWEAFETKLRVAMERAGKWSVGVRFDLAPAAKWLEENNGS